MTKTLPLGQGQGQWREKYESTITTQRQWGGGFCEWDCLMPQPVHWRVKCNFKSVSLMGLVFCQCKGLKQIQPDDKWSSRQISKIQVLFETTKKSPYSWDILCHIGWIENYMLRLMSWSESSRWNDIDDIGFLPNLNMQTWLDELKTTCCDSCHDKIKTWFHKGHCMVMFCIYKTESRIMLKSCPKVS